MENVENSVQTGEKTSKKRRSVEEKVGRHKWIIRTLKKIERRQKIIDRRTRMLAAGLRSLFSLGEDYVSMIVCKDEVDVAILYALREAEATGRQTGELATQLDIDHRDISRRIERMNKKMIQEIGEPVITKKGHKWKIAPRLRKEFTESIIKEEAEDT
ncbi:MAG: hypothetical protein NUK63_03265 [Candidatus Bathyarchaeum tardum]|nr:MAG: hypothetical protein NUK63_03265 [Candidatus Bathyarchaeum tardum]